MKAFFLFLIFTFFYLSSWAQDKPLYKLFLDERCKDTCLIFAYLKAEHYNQENMKALAKEFAEKYKDKDVVNLRLFDDEEIIKAFIEGKREPLNILSDSRGYFIHKAGCGDMLFYKSEKDKIKLVKINWKNDKNCNTPFTVF